MEQITFHGAEFELEPYKHAKPESIQKYWAPRTCAHCRYSIAVEPEAGQVLPYDNEKFAHINAFRCPRCKKAFLVVSEIYRSEDPVLKAFIPVFSPVSVYPNLDSISYSFKEIHQEAYHAYQLGLYRLAGVGFRTALEVLLKDFAISELGVREEDVAGVSLNNVIQNYYKHMCTTDLARAIQLLGNDCTHYINRHKDVPPEKIEKFYRKFVESISLIYEGRHIDD